MSNKDIMFAAKQNLKTTLLHGPAELSKTFLYEVCKSYYMMLINKKYINKRVGNI